MLGEKVLGRDIRIESCSFRLIRSIKKSNFWKLSFFQILQNFERTLTVLGEKLFGRDIKIETCSLRLVRSNKRWNIWKISFFWKTFRTLNEHLPCLTEKFWAGISKLKVVLYVFRVSCCGWKIFLKFCKFSFHSDLEHNFFGFVAAEFSLGLSKLHSTCLFEFSLRCWH